MAFQLQRGWGAGHMGRLKPVDSAGSWKGDYTWRNDVLPFVLHHSRRTGQI